MNELLAVALRAQANAHAPYSRFKVGAALRDQDGRVFGGANVENSAYPQGLCAEAVALGTLVTAGGLRVTEILVVGPGPDLITPCGGCRQKLAELAGPDTPVHLHVAGRAPLTLTLGSLLPRAFGPEQLA